MTHKDIQHVRKMNMYTNIALYAVLSIMLFGIAMHFYLQSFQVTTRGQWMKTNVNIEMLRNGMIFQMLSMGLFVVANALNSVKSYKKYY